MSKKEHSPDSFFNVSFSKGSLSNYKDGKLQKKSSSAAAGNDYQPEGGKPRINSETSAVYSFGSDDTERELLGGNDDDRNNQRVVRQGFVQLQRTVNLLVFGVVVVALMMLLVTIVVIQTKAGNESGTDSANLAGKLEAFVRNNQVTEPHNVTEATSSTPGRTYTTTKIPDVVCGPLKSGGHLTITCSDENKMGSVCQLRCRPPYELDGEAATITCIENENSPLHGVWSPSVPSCVAPDSTCDTIPKRINNGAALCSNGAQDGSVCKFTCDAGYQLNGAASTTCRNGRWSDGAGATSCVEDPCTRIQPCENGGTCNVDAAGTGYTCDCDQGWTGAYCSKARSVQFQVYIKTGTATWSGTDATVQVILYGDSPSSNCGPHRFDGTAENRFENGQTNEFRITCNYLGTISKINIGHDDRNFHSDWLLAKVTVKDLYLDVTYEFPANRWLRNGDGRYVDLTPTNA